MVSTQGILIRKDVPEESKPAFFDCAKLLASEFAARAAHHDRDASFPFENFKELSEAGLLSLTVPTALGGAGAGARDAARIIGIFGFVWSACFAAIPRRRIRTSRKCSTATCAAAVPTLESFTRSNSRRRAAASRF